MNCGDFIGELMRARDIIHIEHLQSKHWGEHIALNEIYDAMVDHVDTVAELRLARGPVAISVDSIPESIDIVPYLEDNLISKIDMAKDRMDDKGYNDISAEIDMIKTTVMKGLYKLKNLTKTSNKSTDKKEEKEDDMTDGGILLYKKKAGGKMPIKKK